MKWERRSQQEVLNILLLLLCMDIIEAQHTDTVLLLMPQCVEYAAAHGTFTEGCCSCCALTEHHDRSKTGTQE